ncbi:hypothetical protein [Streptomyces sp. bgisy154]|uniref:hypothetical protein n=1 Tax=Streptomyces sp. bgisy154 TaxID=3413794 RepID=UPI003D7228DE
MIPRILDRRQLLRPAVLIGTGALIVGGCAGLGLEHPATAPPPTPTVESSSPAPQASAGSARGGLTDAQAHAALITVSDLGAPWAPTRGAATWRDGLLKATTPVAECRRLLDALYTDELLGGPARADIALDNADTGAQLRFQIGGQKPQDVDRTLAWLATMPQTCARFTATAPGGTVQDVRVEAAALPEVGDARQGLRVRLETVPEESEGDGDAEPVTLTLDVAAVRVGEDAFALTNGGLGDVPNEATQAAVQLGALRLADVRKQGRVEV